MWFAWFFAISCSGNPACQPFGFCRSGGALLEGITSQRVDSSHGIGGGLLVLVAFARWTFVWTKYFH